MPDNVAYLNLGLAAVLGVMSLYLVLLVLRFRSAYRQRQMLQDFRETELEVSKHD